MKRYWHIILILSALVLVSCSRDPYVKTMRQGAKAFDKGDYTRAAGLFKETQQDTTTFAGLYNYALASHEAEDDIEAIRALDTLRSQELVPEEYAVPAVLNLANARLTEAVREEAKEKEQEAASGQVPEQGAQQGQKASTGLYQQAMQNYEEYLLEVPEDMDAKERYLFCKSKMPPQEQNGGGGGGGGGSDQNQDQPDQDQNQDQQQQQDQQDQQDQLNEQQIYQMLEAKEKETREKLDEKKARAIQLRQKDRKKW